MRALSCPPGTGEAKELAAQAAPDSLRSQRAQDVFRRLALISAFVAHAALLGGANRPPVSALEPVAFAARAGGAARGRGGTNVEGRAASGVWPRAHPARGLGPGALEASWGRGPQHRALLPLVGLLNLEAAVNPAGRSRLAGKAAPALAAPAAVSEAAEQAMLTGGQDASTQAAVDRAAADALAATADEVPEADAALSRMSRLRMLESSLLQRQRHSESRRLGGGVGPRGLVSVRLHRG
ncbi:unnamed protein product, partial [Prorocentrum cordatum]